MRPVFQTIISNVNGDCMRACVATITGIPIESIPNFSEPNLPWSHEMRQWLSDHGWCIVEAKRDMKPRDFSYLGLLNAVAMATVPSQMFPGCNHAVVIGWRPHPDHSDAGLEPYIVHDPNPNNQPYENIAEIATRVMWLFPQVLDHQMARFSAGER